MNEILKEHLGAVGRMISGTKVAPKDHLCVWNANVIVEGKKVWYGDLNLTKQEKSIQKAADLIGKPIYILREMDCRFSTEENPRLENAVAVIKPKVKS